MVLSARAKFNEKRRPAPPGHWPEHTRRDLLSRIAYEGSPYHKRNPGDFHLAPPALPRDDKTLCDLAFVLKRVDAQRLLLKGVDRGLTARETKDDLPKYIWSVENDIVFEAQITNSLKGTYHGYPLLANDPVRQIVLRWGSDDV